LGWKGHWLRGGQRGSLLLEAAVVLAALSLVGVAVLMGMATTYLAKRQYDAGATNENLLRNQMEYVFEQAYIPPPGQYTTVAAPSGYSVTAEALVYDLTSDNIEVVRATVFRDGEPVKSLDTLRTAR